MRVHLIKPSDTALGTAVITPRRLFVLAAATPDDFGDSILHDQTLEALDVESIQSGDVVGLGSTLGTRCVGMQLGSLPSGEVHSFSLGAFIRRCSQKKRSSVAGRIASFVVMAIWLAVRLFEIIQMARPSDL